MTETFIQLTEDEFDAQYTPIRNHLNRNASWGYDDGPGCLFETYGAELDFVRSQDERTVWTFVDGDDGDQYLVSGLQFVNRIGYLVTTEPIPAGTCIEVHIPMSDDARDDLESDSNRNDRNAQLAEIARTHLLIPTLETRKSDSLDFHTVAVWAVESALTAAHEVGMQSAAAYLSDLRDTLDHVRATLKLRHLDEASDSEVEEAIRMADEVMDRTKACLLAGSFQHRRRSQ